MAGSFGTLNQTSTSRILNWLPRSLSGASVVMTCTLLLLLLPVGWSTYGRHGSSGLFAAIVAAVVCWAGSVVALIVTKAFHGTANAVASVFGAMFFRTGFPLLAAFVLTANSRTLAEAGVFGLILVFYLPALLIETVLSTRILNPGDEEINKAL